MLIRLVLFKPLLRQTSRARWPMASFFTVQPGATSRPTTSTVAERMLDGAPIQTGRLHELNARGRTLKNSLHPLRPQGQAWISEKQINARTQSSFIVFTVHNSQRLTIAGCEHSITSRGASIVYIRHSSPATHESKNNGKRSSPACIYYLLSRTESG